MLHSVILPDTKNGSCDFVVYLYYKRNSIQNSQYFISECNRQLVKHRQSFSCPRNEGIGEVEVQLHSLQTLASVEVSG